MGMDKNNKTFKSKKPYDTKTKADLKKNDKKSAYTGDKGSFIKDAEQPKYKVVPLKERKAEDVKPAAAKKAPAKKAPVKKKK